MTQNLLNKIQDWFHGNCDGDWEHAQNFTITTIDNPGWSVTVNLKETILENRSFSTVNMEKDDLDWYYCVVKNGEFLGDGGPRNLIDILNVFVEWMESNR